MVAKKYDLFSSSYYVEGQNVKTGIEVSFILILTIVVGSLFLICTNVIFSKTFNSLSKIYGILPNVDFGLKILCYIFACNVLGLNFIFSEWLVLTIIFVCLLISVFVGFWLKKILNSTTDAQISQISEKKQVTLSEDKKINYKKAQKIFSGMFWLTVLFCSVFLKYLFFNILVLSLGLFLSFVFIVLAAYRAYSLIFSHRQLIINLLKYSFISLFFVIFVILLYGNVISIWFYPEVTTDELIWLILIPYLLFQLPSKEIYKYLN